VTDPSPHFAPTRDLSELRLIVGWRSSPAHVQVRQVNITKDLQGVLTKAARQTLTDAGGRKEVTYTSEAVVLTTEKAKVPAEYVDLDSAVLKAISPMTFGLADKSDLERDFQFFGYVAGSPGNEIVFISKFNPTRGLSKKKTITRWVNNQLTEISDPVLAFDPGGADLIWAPPDNLIAMSVPVFEFLLRDAPEMVAKLAQRAGELAHVVPMSASSLKVLGEAVQRNSRYRRRLSTILERGHLASVNIGDVKKELRAKGYKTSDYVTKGELDLTDSNVGVALQVLNEDVLLGAFSKVRFAAERKSEA
jgi:hypothetical protein